MIGFMEEQGAMTMPIDYLPDWDRRLACQDAFWYGEILDRPVVSIVLPKENPNYPWPKPKSWPTLRDRWFDAEYRAEEALAWVMNREYLGDALPGFWPNLGPEVFSAYFGCELEYSETTSWAIPNLLNWADADKIKFSRDNIYWQKTNELLDAFLEIGKNKFYTNFTDLHAGGDAVAAFRDPQQLCLDLVLYPDEVKRLLKYVTDVYLDVLDFFHAKLFAAGQAISTGGCMIQSTRRWHYVANDFSYMISKEHFDEIFLPEIERECNHLETCYYHLDGEGALRHVDSLLEVRRINVMSWCYSACNAPASNWMEFYKKCQAKGKGLELHLRMDELDFFIENLRPEGLWINVTDVPDRDQAQAVIKKIAAWK